MGITSVVAQSDFELVTNPFTNFIISHLPREENFRAHLLAKLASTKKRGGNYSIQQETLSHPYVSLV